MSTDLEREGTTEDGITRISREDLLALTAAYKRVGRRTELAGTFGVIGGFAIGAVLLQLRSSLEWAPWLDPAFFATGFLLATSAAFLSWRRQRKLLAAYQFVCPSCNVPMLTSRPWRREVSRAELAASTGSCPSCAARICD
jgi:hypothetical protein